MQKTNILNHKPKKNILLIPLFLILVSCGGGGGSTSTAGTGGSGVVILRYASSLSIVLVGLTGTTYTESSDKVTAITAGTGQVYWE